MNVFRPLLAQNLLPTDVVPGASHWMGLTFTELLTLLGAVAVVTLLLVVWAVYIRKTPRQHSRHYHYPSANQQNSSSSLPDTEPEETNGKRYRRKRRRRREHRPRNPTLAETGGLPPMRSEQPQDPLP